MYKSSSISNTVFITGATGYTGRAIAVAFRRRGYKVYGLVRNEVKARSALLLEEEIIPVYGDALKPETYQSVLKECGIIIECATLTPSSEIVEKLLASTKESGKLENGEKKLFIWTTGFMQYKFENLVLESSDVIGCVVRPAFVYGGSGGVVFQKVLFNKPVEGEKLKIGGSPNKVWPWVHVNDLANGYILIAQNKQIVNGKIFRLGVLDATVTYEKVKLACSKAAGYKSDDFELSKPEGFEAFVDHDIKEFDNKNSLDIGWVHSNEPLLKEIDLHYQSFKAWKSHEIN